jgi:hypothetical protein
MEKSMQTVWSVYLYTMFGTERHLILNSTNLVELIIILNTPSQIYTLKRVTQLKNKILYPKNIHLGTKDMKPSFLK